MNLSSEAFIAFGESEFEPSETLGILIDLAGAQERCEECPGVDEGDGRHSGTAFTGYRIEEWKMGARLPEREWVRDAGALAWERIDWAAKLV